MTPAETPTECEACGQDSDFQRRQAVKICDVESENRQLKFDLESAQSINERKDARIRELEGALKKVCNSTDCLLDCDLGRVDEPPGIIENTEHGAEVESAIAEARAALARSEGGEQVTPAETPKVGDWCWHIHHEVLIEKLMEPFETRKAYIKAEKPKHEVEKRLRLMKPASKKASEAMAVYEKASSEAWAVYDKASSEARAVYGKASSEAMAVYDKARSEAWAVYAKARSEAWAVYDKASSEARAVYGKASSEAMAVYDKARSEAWAVYEKASSEALANSEAWAVYAKARSEAWAKVEALHEKECPNCPFNGRTIFP